MKTQTKALLPPIDPSLRQLAKNLKDVDGEDLQAALTESQAATLKFLWQLWARDEQLPPRGEWVGWLTLTGRGWGKTRTGAEFVRDCVTHGLAQRIGLIARTAADGRDVQVEGESGILSVFPPHQKPTYESTKRKITFHNGAVALLFSADEPDLLRGPQHSLIWADEIASWRFREAWDNAMLGLRLGSHPRWVATTTPRTTSLILELIADAKPAVKRNGIYHSQSPIVVTSGSVYDNLQNLPESFIKHIVRRYEGSRLSMQELYGQLLKDDEAALWRRDTIHSLRVNQAPELRRVVVGLDPAASISEDSSSTGIIVAGVGVDGHGYVIGDYSIHGLPHEWARRAVSAYHGHKANLIVCETNHGGDMVVATILTEDKFIPVKKVVASRGKAIRAEPIANLYERGLLHHVGTFSQLEDELCTWIPGADHQRSPDRLDALVWTLSELMLDIKAPRYGIDYGIHAIPAALVLEVLNRLLRQGV